ncbi:MAG TPA: IPT/TIG domain-containing protein [Solirubrobacteraceae bacterium]|nr:IPT/TIG domain-containing protein [Solirubrobacteraceae bacterium]
MRWLLAAGTVGVALAASGPAQAICKNYPNCGTGNPIAQPGVLGVSPAAGPSTGGTTVDVRVAGFTLQAAHPPTIEFGTSLGRQVKVLTASVASVVSPSHGQGQVDVRVSAPYVNTSSTGGFTPTTGADRFFYCSGQCIPPAVNAMSPTSGPATGGTVVTISGSHLDQALEVQFGSQVVTGFCFDTPNAIQFIAPPSPASAAGPVSVSVITRVGQSAPLSFTYTPVSTAGAHLDDNRNKFTLASLAHLNFLPSFVTDLLPGISGRVIDNPAVHALYWDRNWDSDDPGFAQQAINGQLNSLIGSGYLSDAAQYGVGTPSSTGADVAAPAFLCPKTSAQGGINVFTLMYWITCEAGGSALALSEVPGTGGIEGLPLPDGLPMADDNTDYAIFLPKHASVGLGSLQSCGSFDAFHFFTVVAQLRIGWAWFVPYPDPTYQTVPFIVAPADCASDVPSLVANVSHELVESATDPLDGLGWIDDAKFSFSSLSQIFMEGEASDLCEDSPTADATINGVKVLTYWSNSQQECVPVNVPNCPATTTQTLGFRPSPTLLAVKPRPLYTTALSTLESKPAYKVTATMSALASGVSEPKVSSQYSLWHQSGNRVEFTGKTKVGNGPWTSFDVVQVGGKRCVKGPKKWQCQTGLAPFNAGAILSELFTRDLSTPVTTSGTRRLTVAGAVQGGVSYAGSLSRAADGAPTQLLSSAKVGNAVKASQTVSIDYANAQQTRIALPK